MLFLEAEIRDILSNEIKEMKTVEVFIRGIKMETRKLSM